MQSTGLLVTAWPIVLGCDAGGVVVQVGPDVTSAFKVGDRVCGCTRLGIPGYSTFQQFFLMDSKLTLPILEGFSIEQGATLGVGTYTACLGLLQGLKIKPPEAATPVPQKEEWVVVLGGAGSVGQYTVQIAKALGYKVVASCSQKTAAMVKSLGADAVIDYRKSEAEQLQDLKDITGGNFFGVYDTVAQSEKIARKALMEVSSMKQKYFATTDDWSPMEPNNDHETYRAKLGQIGRSAEENEEEGVPTMNDDIASYIPLLVRLMKEGKLKPNVFKVVGKGFESIAEAVEIQQKGGAPGAKVIVHLQDE